MPSTPQIHSSGHLKERSAAILAGGRSSRFGSNKAVAPWMDQRVIDAVLQTAMAVAETVFIIANDSAPYENLGLPIYADHPPSQGPLSGLHSALAHTPTNRVLLLACDMPLLNTGLLEAMWQTETWAPVVVPRTPDGLEPLHAIYHRGLLPVVEGALRRGEAGLQAFLSAIPRREIPPETLRLFCPSLACLASANTPQALEKLKKLAASAQNRLTPQRPQAKSPPF